MTDYLDFIPLFNETIARVRARMDADANANLQPTDPGYLDTREGTFYYDITQTCALEIVRLWDAIGSETVAVAFPSVAWGDYLDEHAATFGLLRNPAVAAEGVVAVYAPEGTIVPSGALFAAPPSDPSEDTIEFLSTLGATSAPFLAPPAPVTVTPNNAGGTLTPATYYYHLTSVGEVGETAGTSDQSGTITTSAGMNTIEWTAADQADSYNIYRSTSAATLGHLLVSIPAGTTTYVDNGSASLQSAVEPSEDGTIAALCQVTATTQGSSTNLAAGAINELETAVQGVTLVTNLDPTTGGADPEDDEALRARILSQYTGQGAGTIANYVQLGLAYTDVERVAVIPLWDGPGTVLMIAFQSDGSPVSDDVVSGLQAEIDPDPGLGHGQAPIGATVTVATTVPLAINISATITHKDGYSLTGTGGTIATQDAITSELAAYLNTLDPGDTVIYQQVQAAFFVDGVQEVSALLVNSGSTDIVLDTDPNAQSAQLGTLTLS